MKKILVVGTNGQIGSELTPELRKRYGTENVIASDLKQLDGILAEGPTEILDVTDCKALGEIVRKHKIDTIYNLAAILSAIAEKKPQLGWHVGVNGLYNVLEVARENNCAVFTPSSIGAFGPGTPLDKTPQVTIQRPSTIYGVTKVTGELLCDYYFKRFGVDARGVRYPGLVSNVALPGGGTTDYAVEIYYEAIKSGKYTCPLNAETSMDMMYMPDALEAAINVMEADPEKLNNRNAFNVTAMSFTPEIIAAEIRKHIPTFELDYDVEPVKQGIANSWPNSLDDTAARQEWGWSPKYDLSAMTVDMLKAIKIKQEKGLI